MSPTVIPNACPGLRLLAVSWCKDPYGSTVWESPILGWSLAPGADPEPVTLLDLGAVAWCVWEPESGTGFIPHDRVFGTRAEALAELTTQAQWAAR